MTPWWRSAPGLVGLAVVGALLALLFAPRGDITGDVSSFGVTRGGYRLGYELLESLDYEVVRFAHGAELLPAEGTLLLMEPGPALLDEGPAGMAAVAEWVSQGNRLVLGFGGGREDLGTRLLHRIEERRQAEQEQQAAKARQQAEDDLAELEAEVEAALGIEIEGEDAPAPAPPPPPAPSEELLFPSGDTWEALGALGIRQIEHSGPRPALEVGFDDPFEVASPLPGGGTLRAVRHAPVMVGAGVERGEILVEGPDGPLAWRTSLGEGEVILLSDARLLCNWALAGADNAYLLVSLVGAPGGGPVLFEEFSHGYATATSLVKLLLTPPTLFVTLQIGAVLAVVVLWRTRRFGPALPVPTGDRRSKSEHVRALADLHRRGQHGRQAARRMRADLLGRVRDRLGTHLTDENLLEWLEQRLPHDGAELARMLEPPSRPDGRTLLRYARTLEGLRREIEEA